MHKDYFPIASDSLYENLLVGADKNECSLKCKRDNDFPENISFKNPNYCELTGLYWIWKNAQDNIVGLCHYRRYFTKNVWFRQKEALLTNGDVKKILKKYDAIFPQKRKYATMTSKDHFIMCHDALSWAETRKIINEKYPEYIVDFIWFESEKSGYCYNMFVMNMELLDSYCNWLFDILFALEKNINIELKDMYASRIFGFISERLVNVWIKHNNVNVYEMPIYFSEETTPIQKKKDKILKKIIKR